jgi:fatty-acyl-CoA synthase
MPERPAVQHVPQAHHARPTYPELVLTALRREPSAVAFVTGDRQFSYGESAAHIRRMAAVLAQRGVRKGSGVAILSRNRPEAWFATMAAQLLGARTSALHALGSLDDHRYICADAEIGTLVFDPEPYTAHVTELTAKFEPVDVLALGPSSNFDDLLALAERAPEWTPQEATVTDGDVAMLVYTGGTTGRPKGVIRPHRCLIEMVLQLMAEWTWPTRPRFLACAPITHATGMMIVPVLLRGGTVILHEKFEAGRWLAAVEREQATMSFLVPTMLYRILDDPGLATAELGTLEAVYYGAAPMSPERLASAIEEIGPVFVQFYAQAESTVVGTVLRPAEHTPTRLSSCGRPLAGARVEIHDDDNRPVPVGAVGEICMQGPFVMDGYWNEPELTAEALRNGWLHTGDLAVADPEGFITIVGRKKDMVVSGGFNVFPREIEDVLVDHPQVAQAAVVGIPDPDWGEVVLALIVLVDGGSVSTDELLSLVRQRKGSLHVPKVIEVVATLPLTPLGKVDKKAIRAEYWATESRQVH